MSRALTRRRLLAATGWTALGVTAVAVLGGCVTRLMPALPPRRAATPADALGWVQLTPDGALRLRSPRQELGQGTATALAQIVAEEMGLPLAAVELVHPDTASIAEVKATVGSESIQDYARLTALAAASLREELRRRAAARWGVAAAEVTDAAGAFRHAAGHSLTLAELAAGRPTILRAADPAGLTLRSFAAGRRRLVGHGLPPHDLPNLVVGAPLFASDLRLPGMLHGALLRPARLGDGLGAIDEAGLRAIAGFVALVRDGDAVGLVATTPGSLRRLRDAAESAPVGGVAIDGAAIARTMDVDRALRAGRLEHSLADAAIGEAAPWTIDLRIDVPMAAHAALEPRVAVADFRADGPGIELWTGTQDAFHVRRVVARDLGLDEEAVVVHSRRVGGAFGGKSLCSVERDAALLSRAVGRPVKVQWSREDEFQHGFHRPPSSHRVRARLDQHGRLVEWWHAFCSAHVLFTAAVLPGWLQAATSLIGDGGVARGALPPYAVERLRVEFSDLRLPVVTGPWRGLGAGPNGMVIEAAIDALARAAGQDPLAFRLAHLGQQPRLARCLERVAALSGWSARRRGAGWGLACGSYKGTSHVAVAAEVGIDRRDHVVTVSRLYCAHDCGLLINPDQVRAQVEGNLVWGIGMALTEALTVADGRIGVGQLHDYRIPRLPQVPPLEIALIDGDDPPGGAGETAIVAAAGAILNAVADATGRPVGAVPITPVHFAAAGAAPA